MNGAARSKSVRRSEVDSLGMLGRMWAPVAGDLGVCKDAPSWGDLGMFCCFEGSQPRSRTCSRSDPNLNERVKHKILKSSDTDSVLQRDCNLSKRCLNASVCGRWGLVCTRTFALTEKSERFPSSRRGTVEQPRCPAKSPIVQAFGLGCAKLELAW